MSTSVAATPELDHIYAFKTILNFTSSLKEYFGDKNKSLNLYHRLLSKTNFTQDNFIKERIQPFRKFVTSNRTAILEQNQNELVSGDIRLTDKIYIDIKQIMATVDNETRTIIWKHLLAISAILDPTAKAKEFLKKNLNSEEKPENNFLNTMMKTIDDTFQSQGLDTSSENPMALFQSILSSDLIGNLMNSVNSNVENGQIDLGQLMGSMQQMMGSLQTQSGEGGQPDLMGMMAGLMQNINLPDNNSSSDNLSIEDVE
jgi:hypothetical protein